MGVFEPGNFYRRLNNDGERGITQTEFLEGFGAKPDANDSDVIASYGPRDSSADSSTGKPHWAAASIVMTGLAYDLCGGKRDGKAAEQAYRMLQRLDLNKDGEVTVGELREVYSRSAGINGMMSKEECKDLYRDLVTKK